MESEMDSKTKKSIESKLPGWRVEDVPASGRDSVERKQVDMTGPDDNALREKYGRFLRPATDAAPDAHTPEPRTGQSEWVRVRPDKARDSHVGTKAILVDKETGDIKAVQG
jgi:hypothetical protein